MKKLLFKKIDAFATDFSKGNPAGYVQLGSINDLNQTEMLRIAKELSGYVNEIGFLYISGTDVVSLKYYSAEREVDFCGHATIAIMYDLFKNNSVFKEKKYTYIQTNHDRLIVENRIAEEDSVFINSPNPVFESKTPKTDDIAKYLRINKSEIDPKRPISIINAGLSTLIVPIKCLKSILNISPVLNELKGFCFESKIDIIQVFTDEVVDNMNDYRVRVFAPTFGYIEDPATGSGNSAFGYYLVENDIWNSDTVTIEQNKYRTGYNIIKLQRHCCDKEGIRIYFGGSAVTRIEGHYYI